MSIVDVLCKFQAHVTTGESGIVTFDFELDVDRQARVCTRHDLRLTPIVV